ncbi:antitoxin Xre-like helix-turn-helix domain-containing protein [Thioalkalivibrio sp. ALE23]|uniref:antitoxin Xre-like helix-turn-helix domain-containing protein n=1 Tax=Thioalkalivibrio sp. ALE23 TaxID=1265495 RepID=UPI000379C246|nr:antitoxin Xre-like helix-turn-helix domain-containing protein [Thioalkalivibrio sp. ALE23]
MSDRARAISLADLRRLAHDLGLTREQAAEHLGLSRRQLTVCLREVDPYGQIAWPGELTMTPRPHCPRRREVAGFPVISQ